MERTQIYLGAGQRARLSAIANAKGRSMADLVREAVERYLDLQAPQAAVDDPIFGLVGAARDLEAARDVSRNKRRYLAKIGNVPRPRRRNKK